MLDRRRGRVLPGSKARWLLGGGVALLLLVGVVALESAARRFGEETRAAEEIRRVRLELSELRVATEDCAERLAADEIRFQAYGERVDSLRAVVDSFESPERTVPADRFDSYMAAFDEYNAALPGWHELAEALRSESDGCRELAERHNALVDSMNLQVNFGS